MGVGILVLAFLSIVAVVSFGIAWVLMALWNFLIPSLFHGPIVTYWQAYAFYWLLAIVGCFFKASASRKS